MPDGGGLGAERAAAAVARIVAAVDVPVSADIEAGYEDVAATVSAVLQAGAAGVNIEDSQAGVLLSPADQAGRLNQARTAADGASLRPWINARIDVFLTGSGQLSEALAVLTMNVGDATRLDDLDMGRTSRVRCGSPQSAPAPRRSSWSTVMPR